MREIKFRGKNLYDVFVRQEDGGLFTKIQAGRMWLYGGYAEIDGKGYLFPEAKCHQANGDYWMDDDAPDIPIVDKETVGQYTGLKDKNGKEIYEGDIVKRHCNAYGLDYIGVVKYDDEKARFVLYCKERHYAKSLQFMKRQTINDGQCTIEETFTYEIIGNIHDNPELLKEG